MLEHKACYCLKLAYYYFLYNSLVPSILNLACPNALYLWMSALEFV